LTAKFAVRRRTPKWSRAIVLCTAAIALLGSVLQATPATAAGPPDITSGSVEPAAPSEAGKPTPDKNQPKEPVDSRPAAPDLTRPAKNAAKAVETCGGALAWSTVISCDSISDGETDTYSVTTTVPQESVLVRFTVTNEDFGVVATLAGHDGSCEIFRSLTRCELGAVGSYTLTVTGTYNTGDYKLSAASLLGSSCQALSAADLSPAAAGKPGELPVGMVGDCFQFGGTAGDVLRFGPAVSAAKVYDVAGSEVCQVDWWIGSRCTLTGDAPYRALVTALNGQNPSYTLHLARLNSPVGCTALPLAPFGDPGAAVATGTLPLGQTTCRSITTNAGLHSIRYTPGSGTAESVQREIYDQAGQAQCGSPSDGDSCDLPAGTYTVLLDNAYGEEGLTFHLSAIALGSSAGCADQVGTSWALPLLQKVGESPVSLDCQPIDAQAGDRILARSDTSGGGSAAKTRIVDSSGATACVTDFDHDGCLLAGTSPFRVLSELYPGVASTDYSLTIGRLSNPVGCTPTGTTSFGAAAPTAPAGSRCRELTVGTASTYRIDGRTSSEAEGSRGAYGEDGLERCDNLLHCQLEPGKYTFVAGAAERIAIFPLTSTDGCVAQAADSFAAHTGTFAGTSQYDCVTLASPAGAEVVPVEPTGQRVSEGDIKDATGASICSWGWLVEPPVCKLTGTAPFRALIHRAPYQEGNAYRLAVPRMDTTTGCQTLPQSDFTTTGGSAVALTPEKFSKCFVVPASGHSAHEAFQYARTGSAGSARAFIRAADDAGQRCVGETGAAEFTFCQMDAGKAYTVLFVGSEVTAGYRVARRDITSTARGCTTVGSTAVGAISGTGTIADASALRCFKVPGAATDQFVVNTRDAANGIGAAVLKLSGEPQCKTFGEMRCVARGSAGYQVVVWNDPDFGPAGSFSLETARLSTAAGPAAECTKSPSVAYGFGPLTGEVTSTKPNACVTFQQGRYERVTGDASNQVVDGPSPTLNGWTTSGIQSCWSSTPGGAFSCDGADTAAAQVLLLSLPESQTSALKFKVTGVCETPLCGGAVFGVQSVTPKAAVVGSAIGVTLKGTSLHLKDVVRLTAAGMPAVTGRVTSVSADRTTATVGFLLGTAPAGVRDVVVTSFAGKSATLAKAFTVTPKPLAMTKAPAMVGPVQVGVTVKSNPGTWSPAATSAKYQWRDNGVAISGATGSTYLVPAARLGHKLSVTVTASRAGSASTTATSAAVVVARGVASKATKAPAVTGTVQAKRTVGVSVGTWSPGCTSYAYQWYSAGKAVGGATRSTLLLTTAMAKKSLYVAVTCVRTGHNPGRASSAARTVSA